jgi:hypothetical protein
MADEHPDNSQRNGTPTASGNHAVARKKRIKSGRAINSGGLTAKALPEARAQVVCLADRNEFHLDSLCPACPNAKPRGRCRLNGSVPAPGVAVRATFMAIAILKSFDRAHGLAILKLDGTQSEIAAHVTGSDRTVMSSVVRSCGDKEFASTSDVIDGEELSRSM